MDIVRNIEAAVVFAFIGIAVFVLSFIIIDRLTPYDLWKEIVENKNMALAIVVAGMFIALGLIVAAAIHG